MICGAAADETGGINPVLVEIHRGDAIESVHRGSAVVVDSSGGILAQWGRPAHRVFPRSAVKPLQAFPLVESGAADRWDLGPAELALATASHGGAADHVGRISAWLARLGLTPDALVCGPHAPLSTDAAEALIRQGRAPDRLHNNCSGKHAGFLTLARHLDSPVDGYAEPGHPVQMRVAATLARFTGLQVSELVAAVDGCGVPTWAFPLSGLARAFAGLADGATSSDAGPRLLRAMTAFPHLVAGSGRIETDIMAQTAGQVVLKGGAEGVCGAVLPDAGLGIAIKIDDGAKRAVDCAMAALIRHVGGFRDRPDAALADWADQTLRNTRGDVVGHIRPAAGWLD